MHRRPTWHTAVYGLMLSLGVVAALTFAQSVVRLQQVVKQQGDTLEAHGLPRDGKPGSAGRDGADGKAGALGTDGKDGAPGRDGLSIRGQTGASGPPGATGTTGKAGEDGTDGAAGRDGASIQGPAGPAGPQGAPGPAGAQGEQGPAGPQGEKGDPGLSPVAVQVPDGLGGWCLATDSDRDGVYMCPEAAV